MTPSSEDLVAFERKAIGFPCPAHNRKYETKFISHALNELRPCKVSSLDVNRLIANSDATLFECFRNSNMLKSFLDHHPTSPGASKIQFLSIIVWDIVLKYSRDPVPLVANVEHLPFIPCPSGDGTDTTPSKVRLGTAMVDAVQCHGPITADRLHWGSRNAHCGPPVCSRFLLSKSG
jgi:hypothetical protein